jgi:SNF2 family DNA or RNA helicase
MPRVNLLIADDVGLGKTIETGLVIQELIVRNRARSVLIVCPAGLQVHWRDQMHDKFGLEFRIVDSELMRQLRRSCGLHVNPWSHFPRLITSIDFIKRERPSAAVSPGDLAADLEFLMHAARKVEQIREDLGKVGPVLAEQVEEAMLGRRRQLDTALVEEDAAGLRRMLKFERDLQAQIESHYQQLQDTQQTLRLSPDNVRRAVETALSLAKQPPLRPARIPGLADGAAFTLPPLSPGWASAAVGLAHLNHRLVQMALGLLRAEMWNRGVAGYCLSGGDGDGCARYL